jgi:hypothetical protein
METDEDWFLEDFGILFIVKPLRELALSGLTLASRDPEVPPGFEGQTELKTLSITESYIDIGALDNMLSFPRALTCLRLDNRPPRAEDRPDG